MMNLVVADGEGEAHGEPLSNGVRVVKLPAESGPARARNAALKRQKPHSVFCRRGCVIPRIQSNGSDDS